MRIYEAHVGMSSEEGKVNRSLTPLPSPAFLQPILTAIPQLP